MNFKIIKYLFVAALSATLVGCADNEGTLRVGAKPFSESLILAEMIAQVAENEGIAVERNLPFGPTRQVMEAVKQDVLDVYPEYNGTSLIYLGQAPTSDGEASTEIIQNLFKPLGLETAGKFGFSNDYAMVMTEERASELGVRILEDLAKLPTVRFVVDEDFMDRPADGLQQMNRRYGITGSSVEAFSTDTEGKDQIVSALLEGRADVGELFMTDGQIAEYGLVVLEDNLAFFPVYEVAPLVRSDALASIPGLSDVFAKLSGVITAADMQAMNKAVDLDAQTPASVATSFLVEKGLLPEGAASGGPDEIVVAADPSVGRSSSTAKALRAVRVGFPGHDLEIMNYANPLESLVDGSARVAIVGAEAFYSMEGSGLVKKSGVEAFAVLDYKTGHLFSTKSGGASSIGEMTKIATGEEGSGSSIVLGMMLNSLGLSDSIEVVQSGDDILTQVQGLADGQYDGVFAMAPQGDRSVNSAILRAPVKLIGLDEWAEGGHAAKFSFIRPAAIAPRTYPQQFQSIPSVSTQFVLASPVETIQTAGEVGPGTAGTGESSAIPVSASAVGAIREALDSGEVIDPAIPMHASLIPTIEVVDKSLPFRLDISIVNLLMLAFTVWIFYLVSLPSPRGIATPRDEN